MYVQFTSYVYGVDEIIYQWSSKKEYNTRVYWGCKKIQTNIYSNQI